MVELVCPRCHGFLNIDDSKTSASCRECSSHYPFLEDTSAIDFISETCGEQKETQRAIYDGRKEASIKLSYAGRSEHRENLEETIQNLEKYGLPALTMRDAMNSHLFRNIGFSKGMEVLDVGSGSGFLLNSLAWEFGVHGTGVDISSLAVHRSLDYNPRNLAFHLADAERLPFPDASFDRVISFDVLEHLTDQKAAVSEAARVLKSQGIILLYAISIRDEMTWHWTQRLVSGGTAGVDDGGGHVRELFLDPLTVRAWLLEMGFRRVGLAPFHAFFTLLIDERLRCVMNLMSRSRFLFSGLFRLARWADTSLTDRGLGNGFYIWGQRP